ncbi:hypothetical protein [Robbsia sp. KACC 23696]|uniref:hypothetical protein n=1 Tax=Robbsia sp. KACC 23696 TaxID=3149231 RepID=UPI00325BD3E2
MRFILISLLSISFAFAPRLAVADAPPQQSCESGRCYPGEKITISTSDSPLPFVACPTMQISDFVGFEQMAHWVVSMATQREQVSTLSPRKLPTFDKDTGEIIMPDSASPIAVQQAVLKAKAGAISYNAALRRCDPGIQGHTAVVEEIAPRHLARNPPKRGDYLGQAEYFFSPHDPSGTMVKCDNVMRAAEPYDVYSRCVLWFNLPQVDAHVLITPVGQTDKADFAHWKALEAQTIKMIDGFIVH